MPGPTKIKNRFMHMPTKTIVEEVGYASGAIDEETAPGFKKFQGKLEGETATGDRKMLAQSDGDLIFLSQSEDEITSMP